ncbi:hypothetical protein P8452_56476 [Trifolium repens]|nr:hypothetical protein P8452_56476 [Trifolium repens]
MRTPSPFPKPLSKPPDKVLHLCSMSLSKPSPPPKPLDQHLMTLYSPPQRVSILMSSELPRPPPEPLLTGPLPRPPPKPNYCRSQLQPPSDPPDQNITSLGQMFDACRMFSFSITITRTISTGNQPFKQNTICVILQLPIIGRHMAILVLILSCVWHLLSRLVSEILGVERCVLILIGEMGHSQNNIENTPVV